MTGSLGETAGATTATLSYRLRFPRQSNSFSAFAAAGMSSRSGHYMLMYVA
jgi:hypothetical protein